MKQIDYLYIQHKNDIYRYLLHLTHDPTISEDLLQETFIGAIKSINSFKGNSSMKTWLCAIARNVWLQSLRNRNKNINIELDQLIENYIVGSTEDKIITKELACRIKNLINEKDPRTQAIVNMRIEGYSYGDISKEIGITESSARVIDFRIKKWIKETLKKEELI